MGEKDTVQDMIFFISFRTCGSSKLYGTVRAVVSVCDSLNYITDPEDLENVFRLVNNYLDPGGIFFV